MRSIVRLQEFRTAFIASPVRLNILVPRIGIVLIVGKGFPVIEEVLDVVDRDRKAQAPIKDITHIRNPDDLAGQIKQRPAGVAGIYIRIRLNIHQTLERPILRAHYPIGNRALQSERIPDSKNAERTRFRNTAEAAL